jgi:hypothetical protein
MKFFKPLFGLLALAAVSATVVTLPANADNKRKWLSGTVVLETKSIGFIVGAQWGSGNLRYKGRAYRIRVRVFEAGVIGAQVTTFTGKVWNMRSLRDIEGTYAAAGAAGALGAGASIAVLENSKGVIIELKGTSAGLAAKIAAKGFDIRLR